MRTTLPEQSHNGKLYIGIDNGVTGSIGIINADGTQAQFYLTPIFNCLSYTKEVQHVSRIDCIELEHILNTCIGNMAIAVIERPMVNPQRFKASTSALRALEATLITLERVKIPYMFIDSKEWQSVLLPKGIKGADDLKKASKDIGTRLFPQFAHLYKADADGILITEWSRRMQL